MCWPQIQARTSASARGPMLRGAQRWGGMAYLRKTNPRQAILRAFDETMILRSVRGLFLYSAYHWPHCTAKVELIGSTAHITGLDAH
eukprot:scaffold139011_cov13-Tisochrysis_lutea.AAC.1